MENILNIRKRFKRKEKDIFLQTIEDELTKLEYEVVKKKFKRLLTSVNLETRNDHPEYIFMAHYDTGTIMPFWMNWLMKLLGINRQLLMIVVLIGFINFLIPLLGRYQPIIETILSALIYLPLLLILVPNRKNYDDNTSGVIALLKLAKKFKEEGLDNSKFIFVDNEELGLFGSAAHKQYLESKHMIPQNCKVISIDCVGGSGTIPLIIKNSKSAYSKTFNDAIKDEFDDCKLSRMILPASDNFSFKKYGAINISFVSPSIVPNGYYIKAIHSHKDDNIDLEKIDRLCDTLTRLLLSERGTDHINKWKKTTKR